MADANQYPISGINFNDEFILDLRADYDAPEGLEGETFYYLSSAIQFMRPSTIFALADIAGNQKRFLECLKLAEAAYFYPEEAEGIAARALDLFPEWDGRLGDHAFRLILRASVPDTDGWKSIRSIAAKLVNAAGRY